MTDPATLARDWITLWQSELAATAVDREAQETWRFMLSLCSVGQRDDSGALECPVR
jgi:hypothetical protein